MKYVLSLIALVVSVPAFSQTLPTVPRPGATEKDRMVTMALHRTAQSSLEIVADAARTINSQSESSRKYDRLVCRASGLAVAGSTALVANLADSSQGFSSASRNLGNTAKQLLQSTIALSNDCMADTIDPVAVRQHAGVLLELVYKIATAL